MIELKKGIIDTIFNELKKSGLSMRQKYYVGLLQTEIGELNTQENRGISYPYSKLTPTEIKVADLIRIGNTSKEIANLLNLQTNTVDVHRYNIRRKLGIINKKVNLRIYLMAN